MLERVKQKLQQCKAMPTVLFITNDGDVITYKEFSDNKLKYKTTYAISADDNGTFQALGNKIGDREITVNGSKIKITAKQLEISLFKTDDNGNTEELLDTGYIEFEEFVANSLEAKFSWGKEKAAWAVAFKNCAKLQQSLPDFNIYPVKTYESRRYVGVSPSGHKIVSISIPYLEQQEKQKEQEIAEIIEEDREEFEEKDREVEAITLIQRAIELVGKDKVKEILEEL